MSIQNENNLVLNENSVEVKPCINREIKSDNLTIQLYSCYDINTNLLSVVTPPSIYQNTRKGKAEFNFFRILLDSGCNSKIITRRIIYKITPKEDAVMQWHTQVGIITTNIKVEIYFTLPKISATKIVTWNFHVDDSAKGGYDMILGRYLLTALGSNL